MRLFLITTLALGFMFIIASQLKLVAWQSLDSSYQQVRVSHPGWGYWGWGHPGYFGYNCAVTEDYGQPIVTCH
ncbi:MAG: hypothetical protein JSR85_02640 [Proteobacteria bacterium]|nr:hypothetical protein [Pseudomonadota bacterium]